MPNTKEFVTPLGNKIVIKSFLTYNDLEPTLGLEDTIAKSNKVMELSIISINGVTDSPYKLVRELPISEYKAISQEVTSSLTGNFTPAK